MRKSKIATLLTMLTIAEVFGIREQPVRQKKEIKYSTKERALLTEMRSKRKKKNTTAKRSRRRNRI